MEATGGFGVVELTKQRASCTKFTVFRVCVLPNNFKNSKKCKNSKTEAQKLYCNKLKRHFLVLQLLDIFCDSSDCQRLKFILFGPIKYEFL